MMIEIKICFSTTGALPMDESVLRALKAAAMHDLLLHFFPYDQISKILFGCASSTF